MARPASAATVLVPVLTLLGGLAVGWATNPFGGAAVEAGSTQRLAPPRDETERAPARDLLPPDPGATSPAAHRVAAAGEPPMSEEALQEVQVAPEGEPAPLTLVAELSAILRSGRIESALAHDAARMLQYAMQAYIAAGAPREALALIQRHEGIDADLYAQVGYLLMQAEDPEGAALAFRARLEALGAEGFDLDDLQSLAQVDPRAALEVLDAREGTLDPFQAALARSQRAVLLARVGEGAASLALLRELVAEGALDEQALEALEHLSPEDAQAFLRGSLERDEDGTATVALARRLAEGEGDEEAVRLLRELLARRPDDVRALSTLFAIDAAGSLDLLVDPSRRLPGEVWARAGHTLQELGRTHEAVDAWLHALELSPWDTEVGDALIEHAPHLLWRHTEQTAARTTDDEVFGDLGDLNWRGGRKALAMDLWRRARAIDPYDGEWSVKLRMAALGQDPLGY